MKENCAYELGRDDTTEDNCKFIIECYDTMKEIANTKWNEVIPRMTIEITKWDGMIPRRQLRIPSVDEKIKRRQFRLQTGIS